MCIDFLATLLNDAVCCAVLSQAAKAFRSCLMKRCFVHESMAKFIKAVQAEGNVEVNVIRGDVADTEFGRYGMIVFELFYRVDLSTM